MTKRKILRFGTLACVFMVLLCALATPTHAETAAERYKRLKGELEVIAGQIESAKNDQTKAQQLKSYYASEKQLREAAIEAKKEEIAQTREALAAKELEIADKRQVIYDNDQLFQQRLRAIYKLNNSNTLSELLNVNSFGELLEVLHNLQRIAVNDTDLLDLLNTQRAELEQQQEEINGLLGQLETDYADLEEQVNALAANIGAQDAAISAAEADQAAKEQAYDATRAEAEKAYQEMLAASNNAGSSGSSKGDGSVYEGGALMWPVPNFYNISCHFGSPDPAGRAHLGMDISGGGANITGATIVAAGKGTVVIAATHSSYGNYIVVDHGDGFKTLYAHCQSLLVGVGTPVEAGSPIATVGSTGFVTGPHLHFEVHNPGRQNPLSYLKA